MIKTERLRIVSLEEKHLEPLRQLRNDPSTWRWLTSVDFISGEDQKKWYRHLIKDKTRLYLAIEEEHLEEMQKITISTTSSSFLTTYPIYFVGIIRSDEWDKINRSVRIGIDICPEFRGKGYATEAFEAFIDWLFKQQNMHRVWFMVAQENKIAQKLYDKFGFKKEGVQRDALFRDGKYQNYLMMSLLENEWKNTK